MLKPETMEGVTFTLIGEDARKVFDMVTAEGFERSSSGVKAFLLYLTEDPAPEEAGEEKPELSDAVKSILEAVKENPELVRAGIKEGSQILASLMRKLKK